MKKELLLKAIPISISMLFLGIYSIFEYYFLNSIDNNYKSIISSSLIINSVIAALAYTIGIGAHSQITRNKLNKDLVKKIYSSSILFSTLIGIILMITGLLFSNKLAVIFIDNPFVIKGATIYYQCIFISIPFQILVIVLNNEIRGEGKIIFSSLGLVICGTLNLVLDLVFIKYKTLGLGLSLIIAYALTLIIYLVYIISKRKITKVIDYKLFFKIFYIGLPASFRQITQVILVIIIERFIIDNNLKYEIILINRFLLLLKGIIIGIGQAYQVLLGDIINKDKKELISLYKYTIRIDIICSILIQIVILLFLPKIAKCYNVNPSIIIMNSLQLILICQNIILFQTYQLLGKVLISCIMQIINSGLVLGILIIIFYYIKNIYIYKYIFILEGLLIYGISWIINKNISKTFVYIK